MEQKFFELIDYNCDKSKTLESFKKIFKYKTDLVIRKTSISTTEFKTLNKFRCPHHYISKNCLRYLSVIAIKEKI